MLDYLIPMIPSHVSYVEVFGGGAQLLLAKPKHISKLECYNDKDQHLVEFFQAIQHNDDSEILIDRWQNTPYSRSEYMRCLKGWKYEKDRLERIYQWFIVARMSFSGKFGAGWAFSIKETRRSQVFKNVVDGLYAVRERIRDWQIECKDWEDMFETYDHKDAFFYLDPPYVHSTRKAGGYAHEMTDDDHVRFIERIQTLQGKVMLSGYANDIYEALPWKRRDIETVASSAGKTRHTGLKGVGMLKKHQGRIESIWTSYDPDSQLNLF